MSQVYKYITDQIIEQLQKGVIPWHKSWASAMPRNATSNKYYNGINVILLKMQNRKNPNWLTYRQCKELGGYVNKGEKSTQIIFWKFSERENEEGDIKKSFILRYYRVFNIEQTSLSEDERFAIKQHDHDPIKECENMVDDYTDKPPITHSDSTKAYYAPLKDLINIPEMSRFDKVQEYYSTLFHEMVHSTGHKDRLDRKIGTVFASDTYSKEELIAELGACFLCGDAGIETRTINNSASYIASWLKKLQNDDKLIIQAATKAQKAVELIKGCGDT